jgi:transposase
VDGDIADLPNDVDALKAALTVGRAKMREVVAERDASAAALAVARAKASEDLALIAHQKLRIAKLERQLYGPHSERSERLIDQLALQFEELEASATEDELAAESAVAKTTTVAAFTRKRPERNTFPEHLPRERVVIDPPTACDCCGGTRLRKLGEDVTRTLESIPRQWKVIETVREKFTCQDCEKISQAPAPFHVIPRGWAGANLLAMIVFEKFGQHQPLNRQAERYAREGVPISLSTMADAVGASCMALDPILRLVEAHVLAAERLHGDDTTVPVLAKGKTDTGRCWVYVRDDMPFGGTAPPAALFYYSRDRKGEHPQRHLANYTGLFQADAFDGYRQLYLPDRSPGPIVEAGCWVHARRPFFAMADLEENARRQAAGKKAVVLSPIAIEVVRRIDALFDIERTINGKSAEERTAVRQELSKPLVEALQIYMREQRAKLSRGHDLAKAIDYILKRWTAFTLFLDDGRVIEQCRGTRPARHRSGQEVLAILRIRSRWRTCCCHVQPHRHRQDERRRSAGLAGRCAVPHCHVSGPSAGQLTAVELDAQPVPHGCRGSMNMAPTNKVHHVRTIALVAEMLGEDEDWLWDVANEMDQEDGLIWVYGPGDDGVMAFTDFGIETLTGLIEIYKADPDLLKRSSDPK